MTNKDEIERLFRIHYERLHRLARVLLHDSGLACDVVHDVFVSLIDGDAGHSVSEGYLLSAVRNRCLNHIRNSDARRRIIGLYLFEQSEYDSEEWPDEDTVAEINSLMDSLLRGRCRQVVDLRFREGLPYAQIALRLGISEVAVYKHLRHAIETIRKNLKRHG